MDIRSWFGARRSWTSLLGLLIFLTWAVPAAAFDVPTFTVTPSTTQAGGHPDVTIQIDRTGTDNEDIRDLYLDLPPGLIGNTTTVGACTDAQFNSDTCPANSQVGSVTADAVAVGLSLPPTTGSIYNLVPAPTEPGAIGIVLRPSGAPAISPVFIRGSIEVAPNGPNDVNLRNIVLNQPRQVFVLGVVPVDITVNSLTLTLNGAGTLAPNTYFLTNPTSCITAISKARVVSYLDQEVTKESSYTPTNCEAVPFDPFFEVDFNPTTVGQLSAPITSAGTPANQHPLSQSHIKETNIEFPFSSVFLDFIVAGRLPTCREADIANCPPSLAIGDITATVPVIDPPSFTGKLYRTAPSPEAFFTVAAFLEGPRGVTATVRGYSTFTGDAGSFIFPAQPQVPLTELNVELTRKIYRNLGSCGTKVIPAHFVGHSGATADVSDTFKNTGFNCEYSRPISATPTVVRLVPAFEPCTSPNSSHGAPLASSSCNPPVASSNFLTVGIADANGNPSAFNGEMRLRVVGESPVNANNGDQADVQITANLTDVRNAGDLTDYTGELRGVLPLRITDRYSGSALDNSATSADSPFGFNIGCSATPGPEGANCSVTTSADAVMPGAVTEGKRGIWGLGQAQVFDGGSDGDADTAGDNTLFAVQGTFSP